MPRHLPTLYEQRERTKRGVGMRRSTMGSAGANERVQLRAAVAAIAHDARAAEKQFVDEAKAHLKKQHMRSISYWMAPGMEVEGGATSSSSSATTSSSSSVATPATTSSITDGSKSTVASDPSVGSALSRLISAAHSRLGLNEKCVVDVGASFKEL